MSVATLGAGNVLVDTARTTRTVRHLGAILSPVGMYNVLSVIVNSAYALDVWTPSGIGAYTQITYQGPSEESATTYSASGSTAANLADDLGQIDRVTQAYTINQTTAAVTGRVAGEDGEFTATSGITWTHTTTGSEGEDIPVGRGVVFLSYDTGAGTDGVPLVGLPATTTESAQVETYAVTYHSSGLYVVHVVWNNKIYDTTTIAGNTNDATTATDLATAVNAAMPAESVIASTSSGNLILTSEVEGQAFESWAEASGNTAAEMVKTYTTGAPGTTTSDILVDLLGVMTSDGSVNNSSGDAVFKPSMIGQVLTKGLIVVANSQTVTAHTQVFMSIASATKGLFYNANATDYIPIPITRARWVRDLGNGYAVLELL